MKLVSRRLTSMVVQDLPTIARGESEITSRTIDLRFPHRPQLCPHYSWSNRSRYFWCVIFLSESRYCCSETRFLCPEISMISRRFQPLWSRWVNLDLRKLWVDPPTIPIQSNVLRKNWSTDCVEIDFSPLLNFVFFESVKNTWSSVVRPCCLIHDRRPSITLGWIGTILDSFVLVDDFSIVIVPSTKFRFLTLMVVISFTRPAEKYISSASSEYLIGRLEQIDSIWSSVRQADFPDRLVLHIGHQREGRWTWDRVLLDDQPCSTIILLDLLPKRPSIKSSYDSILFVGVCSWSIRRSVSIKIWTNITIWFDFGID